MTNTFVPATRSKRLVSLDVLRGFDMFWIIGARAIAAGLVALNLPGSTVIAGELTHSKWNGFTFYDLIFPLFIFITGVSLVFSLQRRLEHGDDRKALVKHVLMRTVTLFVIGVVYNGGSSLADIRVMGVLQRSALCYFFASLLFLYTKPRTQAAAFAGILAGYWAVMQFVPVPGYGAGILTEQGNLVRYIDSLLLPGRMFFGSWDPEGILSTLPAVATCLLGVLTGHWLRIADKQPGRGLTANKHTLYLFLAGFSLVLASHLINPYFPVNKSLWTSSFVLLSGGYSVMLLTALYWIIDVRGYRRWAFPFVVIGMNSIFIYLAARFIPFDKFAQWIVGGNLFAFFGQGQPLLTAIAQLALEVLLLFWLYNRKTFIRI